MCQDFKCFSNRTGLNYVKIFIFREIMTKYIQYFLFVINRKDGYSLFRHVHRYEIHQNR